jgi:FKBP-type peptidyl-prolyl cis-trans isomerase FkpA
MKLAPSAVLLCLALLAAGCAHPAPPPPASAAGADLSPQARWEAGQAAYLAWNARQPGWRTTASGLQYKVLKRAPASSPRPTPVSVVTAHYTGAFIDGRKFDSSRDRGEPSSFPLNRVIPGWTEGVPMMRVGERWLFAIPADLAYGNRNRNPIPNGSALLFDIELVAIGEEP